jgi:hypothetical protein
MTPPRAAMGTLQSAGVRQTEPRQAPKPRCSVEEAGDAYLNIHTTMFPGGEIRGFQPLSLSFCHRSRRTRSAWLAQEEEGYRATVPFRVRSSKKPLRASIARGGTQHRRGLVAWRQPRSLAAARDEGSN